jgi:hypothetical protein
MKDNIPFFECPDKSFEQIYYFRWWTFRKHIKKTPDGFVFTEFLDKVGHSGKYNTTSCALGHHIYEGAWLRDKQYIAMPGFGTWVMQAACSRIFISTATGGHGHFSAGIW